ncbi:phage tail spike protein [Limosilactobacillus fermentum]|uniref:phage tail spike protein n=1 Tax=Limosilactobacillus fermentum TaxID=1613 RepID=UPI00352ADD93
MRMYLLDKKQRVRRWLKDNDFIEAEMTEEINAANQINFSTPLKDRIADNIYYVAIPTPRSKQKYLLFKLLSERVQNDRIEYQGIEEAYDELKQYGYIKDIRPNDRTAEEMLKMVLEPTRWTLGNVTETSHQSTNLYYITYLEALQKIVGLFNIELTFEVTIDPKSNKITRRQVNIYTEQGQRTGKRFEYGSNLLTVQQEQDSQELITALVGRGKGELVSEGHDDTPDGYGRRITFADVVWTKKDGNPVDKPAGQEYLIDPEATALYGFSDGNPRIGLTVFEDIEDPVELINATWRALQSLKRPKVSFKADVTDVGQLGLGDTVTIIRHDLKIEYLTRVYKVKHNLLNENDNQIELGDDFSGHSITSSLIKVDEIANEARETAGYAAIAANGKNNNYYSSVQPLAPVEGDIWYKDLGNGETDMYQYHNGGWVFIQSTRDLHVVENQVKEAQQGLDQAKADIINNKQKADADIENLNKSIEANKKTADESLQKLNDSVANLQGQYDNNIVPNLNQVTADVADALQKYTTAQQNIADLTKQAQQQGKDLADITSTVNGLKINYASLAGDVSSTKVDVKGLQTTIGTATGDIAQLKLDAQRLQTMLAGKVDDSVYQNFVTLTKQALAAKLTASDLAGYAKTVDVQATANGLQLNIDSVNGRLDNLKIGGRNLLTNTDKDISVTSHTTSGYPAWVYIDTGFSFENGKTYTFSAEANNSTDKIAEASIRVYEHSTNTQVGIYAFPADGKRHSVTFTIPNDSHNYHLLLYAGHAGIIPGVDVTTTYHHPKLEFGNVATDWSPAPEDVANDITQLSARITANSQQFSSYYTKSETDSKANTAKNDAINAIKGDTNWTGLTNIITNSGFLQSADGFVQKVQQTTIPMFNGGGINLATKTGNVSLSGGYNSSKNIGYISLDAINDLCGKYMTVSVDVEWSGWKSGNQNRLGYELQINYDDGSTEYDGCWLTPTTANGKQRVTATHKIKDQHVKSLGEGNAYIQINCTSAKVSRLKIEQGSVATPWTPNPADLATQSAFSELSQSLEGLRSTVGSNYGSLQSQISQIAKNIRQEVSDKTSGLQTQITQRANSFNVSLNALRNETAWQKVTTAIDANNYTTTGNYWIQAAPNSNTPDGSAWAYLQVVAYPDVQRIKQTWQRDNNANEAFTRLKTGNDWSEWQKTVTAGNIMAQINMSAGTTLIQNNKIYMDADSTIFSGKAFIPSAAITSLNADKITTGTLNAGNVNIINMNADNIIAGTIKGTNLSINLNSGEVEFQHGRIHNFSNTVDINLDQNYISTANYNTRALLKNGELQLTQPNIFDTNGNWYFRLFNGGGAGDAWAGASLIGRDSVIVANEANAEGAMGFTSNPIGTATFSGLFTGKGTNNWMPTVLGGAERGVLIKGGKSISSEFMHGGPLVPGSPYIAVGSDSSASNFWDNRIVIDAEYVHILSAQRQTTGSSPNLFIADDGALVRSTSASKYKTDIQRSHSLDYGERLLSLPTATWLDKAEERRFASGESKDKPVTHFGMIAEDLAAAGLEMLVSRGQDGELEGIQYDRIAPALLPVIKKLQDRIEKLEEKLNER